ncbi:MAG: hypothetical protein KJ606_11645 [Chloroflexi bacterium]|nr:hypothetical protein [Chloroflexota bacterium]
MPKTIQVSDVLATLALILSTISLYVSWRQYRRDVSRLKIRLDFQVFIGKGSAYLVYITNTGRRPATVSKVYARMRGEGHYPVFDAKRLLAETETLDLSVPLAGFTSSLRHPLDITMIEVEDSAGKVYKAGLSNYGGISVKSGGPK